jgi:hypothetical protein
MKTQKFVRALCSLLIAFVLAGCSGGSSKITQENYNKIKEGMSRAAVIEILGEPTGTEVVGQVNDTEVKAPIWQGNGLKVVAGFDGNDRLIAKRLDKE